MSNKKRVFFTPLSPLHFLKRSVDVFPDREAVVYEDKRYTYRQFYERVMRMANGLKELGIERGDKVAFISSSLPPLLEAHYGIPWLGASLVAINTRLSSRELCYIINHSESKVLFLDTEFVPTIEAIKDELKGVKAFINVVDVEREKRIEGLEYEAFLSESPPSELEVAVEDENELIAIDYTSGTTGLPKGVMYHHRGTFISTFCQIVEAGLNSDSVYLWTLPMFHCNGWCFTWGVTAVGGKHVCLRRVDAAKITELVQNERVTHMCGAPTVYLTISQYMIANNMKFPRKVTCYMGGSPPSPLLIDNIESVGGNLVHIYGLTESLGPYSICEWHSEWNSLSSEERARLKARQGVPNPSSEMKVVDDDMNEVPHDGQTMGEIVMRGNCVMMGYYKEQDKTDEAFMGGWFHTGDLAAVHPDGYVEIKDRRKDIIISGGENISTVEIEKAVYEHPDVLEVAVIAVPDEKWGEVPKAIVSLKPGRNPTENDIINFCRERLARFKVPKKMEFVGELPKTSTGKIMKYALREKEWAGYEKRVH